MLHHLDSRVSELEEGGAADRPPCISHHLLYITLRQGRAHEAPCITRRKVALNTDATVHASLKSSFSRVKHQFLSNPIIHLLAVQRGDNFGVGEVDEKDFVRFLERERNLLVSSELNLSCGSDCERRRSSVKIGCFEVF